MNNSDKEIMRKRPKYWPPTPDLSEFDGVSSNAKFIISFLDLYRKETYSSASSYLNYVWEDTKTIGFSFYCAYKQENEEIIDDHIAELNYNKDLEGWNNFLKRGCLVQQTYETCGNFLMTKAKEQGVRFVPLGLFKVLSDYPVKMKKLLQIDRYFNRNTEFAGRVSTKEDKQNVEAIRLIDVRYLNLNLFPAYASLRDSSLSALRRIPLPLLGLLPVPNIGWNPYVFSKIVHSNEELSEEFIDILHNLMYGTGKQKRLPGIGLLHPHEILSY